MRSASFLLLVCSSVAGGQARPSGPPVRVETRTSVADIDPNELSLLALKVRAIRAEPTTITLRVGQTISLDAIKVVVVDSAGKVRGRLRGYDFSIKPNEPATAVPRQVTGVRAGTTELTIRYPRTAWKARSDPRAEVKVKVVVKP